MTPITWPFACALFGLLLVALGASVYVAYVQARFLSYLETAHHELWQSLGSPRIMSWNFDYRFAFSRFLALRRYRGVGDPELTRMGNAVWGVEVILYFTIIAFIAAGWLGML